MEETIKIITFDEFIQMVKKMRHNQRRFECLRKPEIDNTRIKLEKEVDEILEKLTDTQKDIWG